MVYFLLFLSLFSIQQVSAHNDTQDGVIGEDNRIQITEENQQPIHHSMGALSIRFNGKRFRCSGSVIGPRHVITAAHCLLQGVKFPDLIIFYPGLLKDPNSEELPLGKFVSTKVKVFPAYLKSRVEDHDVGLVIFDENLPVHALDIEPVSRILNLRYLNLIVSGYPGDKPNGTMWESEERSMIKFHQNTGTHFLDTMPGMSGASIRLNDKIVAIHSSGLKDKQGKFVKNRAHFFSRNSLNIILEWLHQ